MDQDDPEKRLVELERERLQLIEQQRISSQERQLAAAEANAKWAAARLRAPKSGRRASRVGRTRRKWAPLGLSVVMGLVLCNVVAQLLEAFVPSSVRWMDGIVCASGYHLAPNSSSYSYGTHSGTNINFRCVNGASGYDTSVWPIHVLLIVAIALVLCGVAAVGVLMWRQMRKPR